MGKFNEATIRAVLDHLERGGTVRGACGCAGIGKSTFFDWQKDNPEFAEQVEAARGKAIHRAETLLELAINTGNDRALMFWLRCMAGYTFTERREISGSLETGSNPVPEKIFELLKKAGPETRGRFVAGVEALVGSGGLTTGSRRNDLAPGGDLDRLRPGAARHD